MFPNSLSKWEKSALQDEQNPLEFEHLHKLASKHGRVSNRVLNFFGKTVTSTREILVFLLKITSYLSVYSLPLLQKIIVYESDKSSQTPFHYFDHNLSND